MKVNSARLTAVLIFLIGILLFLSILSYLRQNETFLIGPGAFFYRSFLWASFYIPAYFIASSLILWIRPFRKDRLILLITTILPFLTFSLAFKLLIEDETTTSQLLRSLLSVFGRTPAAILSILLGVMEILLLFRLSKSLKKAYLSSHEKIAGEDISYTTPVTPVDVTETHVDYAPIKDPSTITQVPPLLSPPEEESLPEELTSPADVDLQTPLVEDAEFERVESMSPATYSIPIRGILHDYNGHEYWKIDSETQRLGTVLMETLKEFQISAELTGIQKGPVITMFEVLPSPGVKLSRIVNLADNFALRLAASRVRIVAPIPGKHAVGIEVPNKKRSIVPFREMITQEQFQNDHFELPIVLGKNISGESQIVDLTQTPHLLIAGATGSGKSVCVNSIIASLLYKKTPSEMKLLLIDPKIVELKLYNQIPHLMTPVITEPKRAYQALQYCIYEMERRYSLLDKMEVRDIRSYNQKVVRDKLANEKLPLIVIVIDEFADLMATSGKEMETILARLAAMSRAVGLHLVLATQRPSVDVITGLIKANIPSRIAFMVASKFDSRIIIDTVGAEKLLGKGDMLFISSWDPFPSRIQGSFLSEDELEGITSHVRTLGEPDYIDDEMFFDEDDEGTLPLDATDPLMNQALDIVLTAGKASASYLQRRLKIGYNRAARIVEQMEAQGIVGPPQGSKPREVIHVPDRS